VLYGVLAVSIFSVFALQDQAPQLIADRLEKEIGLEEEANFSITVKNPSILEKEFDLVLEKDMPSEWVASLCDESQCYYDRCSTSIGPLGELQFTVHMLTDATGKMGSVRLHLYYQDRIQDIARFSVTTPAEYQFSAHLLDTLIESNGVKFTIEITNTGNIPDTYTLSVPADVNAHMDTDSLQLQPGTTHTISVFIEEQQSINTSLVVTSTSELVETVYLVYEKELKPDFELYSPKEFYLDQEEGEITFDLINMGDCSDVFSITTTCLSPGWEAQAHHTSITIDSKASERIPVWIKRGEGKNSAVIISVTSESGLSKNSKVTVYAQETQGKTVLAEYFTGTWCYVCSYGERALKQLAEEFENLIVLVYHLKDEIETPGSLIRSSGVYGFSDTVSTLVVNGTKHIYYSSGGEGAIYFKYKAIIEDMLSDPLKAEIFVSGRTMQKTAYVTAEIRSFSPHTADVYFVLFKNDMHIRGELKQYIVRDVGDPQRIFLTDGETQLSCEFELPAGESFEGYGVVVILQDPYTLQVIQSTSYMF
jgi:thiol-disulfide isomerase/thioredoxin